MLFYELLCYMLNCTSRAEFMSDTHWCLPHCGSSLQRKPLSFHCSPLGNSQPKVSNLKSNVTPATIKGSVASISVFKKLVEAPVSGRVLFQRIILFFSLTAFHKWQYSYNAGYIGSAKIKSLQRWDVLCNFERRYLYRKFMTTFLLLLKEWGVSQYRRSINMR